MHYKSSCERLMSMDNSASLFWLGVMFSAIGAAAIFGVGAFFLLLLMAAVPAGVFLYYVLKRKKGAFFWACETLLLVLGLMPFILAALGIDTPISRSGEEFLKFAGLYILLLFTVFFIIESRRSYLRLYFVRHSLDMLLQTISYGNLVDITRIQMRFQEMTGRMANASRWFAVEYARLLCRLDHTPIEGIPDDLLHKWIVRTQGFVPLKEFVQNERKLD